MRYARICWNSAGWVFPTGEAAKLERGTYAAQHGFGHEEWLFNIAWQLGGYHYSYLQPVGASRRKQEGKAFDILLYTIDDRNRWLYVSQISNCHILDEREAQQALKAYHQRGWLREMVEHVSRVSGATSVITPRTDPTWLFNIKFKPEDIQTFVPYRRVAKNDRVRRIRRYTFARVEPATVQRKAGNGKPFTPNFALINRSAQPALAYDPIHKKMQVEIGRHLRKQYGRSQVEIEKNGIDIRVVNGKDVYILELKKSIPARLSIREAIGQLLEYAYYSAQESTLRITLVVVSPAPLDRDAQCYLATLKKRFRLNILYRRYTAGQVFSLL